MHGVVDMAQWCWMGISLVASASQIAASYVAVATVAVAAVVLCYTIGSGAIRAVSAARDCACRSACTVFVPGIWGSVEDCRRFRNSVPASRHFRERQALLPAFDGGVRSTTRSPPVGTPAVSEQSACRRRCDMHRACVCE